MKGHHLLTIKQIEAFKQDGYLVLENYINTQQRHRLMQRAEQLIEEFQPLANPSVFTTNEQERSSDDYFLSSGNKIRFFFEEEAIDQHGNFTVQKQQSINKIGHAQPLLDPEYKQVVDELDFHSLGRQLGIKSPRSIQSMHVFKQPNIGGEVTLHQDSTFLYTEPMSCIGFWLALEEATRENGCLQVIPKGHKIALKKRFKLAADGGTQFDILNDSPWPEQPLEMLEAAAGTLIILHGQLPHYSAANRSSRSRQAFTLHLVDKLCDYPQDNWLQTDLV